MSINGIDGIDGIGYKVVTSNLKSIIHKNSPIAVQYKINEWVYPSINNALMCFDTIYRAHYFNTVYSGDIYKCEYIICKNPIFITQNLYSDRVIRISQAIQTLREFGYKIEDKSDCAPEDTVFCSQIKLLEKMV